MLRHYLLTAYRVLLRRKFFSFVNVFGIALTLAVVTAVVAFGRNYVAPLGAESTAENYLAAHRLELTDKERTSNWSWSLGYKFIENYVYPLTTPDDIGIFRSAREGTLFIDGAKLTPDVVATDAGYWRILDFDFIAGRAISDDDVNNGATVAVINRSTAQKLFDDVTNAPGQRIELDGRRFEVIGVVEDEPAMRMHSAGEIFVPHSSDASGGYRDLWIDGYTALAYVEDRRRLDLVRAEYQAMLDDFEYDDPERFQVAHSNMNSKLEVLVRDINGTSYDKDAGIEQFIGIVVGCALAFMFLPAINLVNLNMSRIMERAGEIGVRKAFGASVRTMVGQFLIENLLLSLLGGVLGIALGVLALEAIEFSGILPYANFEIDFATVGIAFGVILIFSVLSGLYPAWKMARMDPVDALKRG